LDLCVNEIIPAAFNFSNVILLIRILVSESHHLIFSAESAESRWLYIFINKKKNENNLLAK